MNTRLQTKNLTKIALCVAILCVTSFLVVPLPFTPVVISLHSVVINIIGLILRPRHAGIAVLTYILMGLIGLPVFSAGTSGPGKVFGPTGGFYLGFVLAAVAISLLRGRKNNLKHFCIITIGAGMPIQHLCAVLVMCMHNGGNLGTAIATASLPFLLVDVIKCVMASIVAVALNKVLKNR